MNEGLLLKGFIVLLCYSKKIFNMFRFAVISDWEREVIR